MKTFGFALKMTQIWNSSCYSRSLMTAVLLILPLSNAEGNLQTVATTECPSTFTLGVNLVTCKIYGDNLACNPQPTKIQIYLTKNRDNSILVGPGYPPTSCSSTSDTIPDGDAECTNKVGNTSTYLYKFVAESKNASIVGDKLQCKVVCIGGTPHVEGEPCSITFAEGPDCEPLDCGKGVSVCAKRKDDGPPKARCNCTGTGLTGTQCDESETESTSNATKGDNALWFAVGSSVGLGLVLTVVMATVCYLKKTRRTQEKANGDTTNITNSPAGVGQDSASAKAAQETTATAAPETTAESKNPFSPNEDDTQSDYSESGAEESEASVATEG